jgi:ATP-dependent Clp protease adaptor protein ClpS
MPEDRLDRHMHHALSANGGEDQSGAGAHQSEGAGAAVKPQPARPRVDRLPPWRVLLHNDDVNEMGYVVETVIELASMEPQMALVRTVEAHKSGVALLVTTHREHAELLQEQFMSKGLTVTIEPEG